MTRLAQLLSISMLFLASCGSDDETETPTSPFEDGILNYDGVNFSSPSFAPGRNEVGITFSSSVLSTEVGKKLSEVQYYLYESPENIKIVVYKGSTSTAPGSIVYSSEVSSGQVSTNQWNTHILSEDVLVDSQDLWICIEFNHSTNAQLIGCDAGPQIGNGAMILAESTTSWVPFTSNINWNIRGKLTD